MSFINEMQIGSMVRMFFQFPKGNITLETKIDSMLEDNKEIGVYCDYLTHDGKILNCSEGLTHVEIDDLESGRTFQFKNVKAMNSARAGKLVLKCPIDTKPVNYRDACRYPCGYACEIVLHSQSGVINTTVHDLSLTGASFVLDKKVNADIGDIMGITITDAAFKNVRMRCTGRIVRIDEDFAESKKLIGATIAEESVIRPIVQRLQRNSLKVKGV